MKHEIPAALLAAHPQLEFIYAAIHAHRAGEEAVPCPKCDVPIEVAELDEVGVLQTSCACGYCRYRMKWAPPG